MSAILRSDTMIAVTRIGQTRRPSPAARIAANDAVIERVNRKLPGGSKWIDSAELIARKLRNFNDGTADVPRIAKHMRLSAFRYSGLDPYIWPSSKR
jgi:hypothetical protein